MAGAAGVPEASRESRAVLGMGLARSRGLGRKTRPCPCAQTRFSESTVSGRPDQGAEGRLSPACEAVIAELPASGSLVGNNRLREATGLSVRAYQEAVEDLLNLGLVRTGPGRGGSLGLIVAGGRKGPSAESQSRDKGTGHSGSAVTGGSNRQAPAPRSTTAPTPSRRNGPTSSRRNGSTEPLGFEATLWKAADKLRGSMDASEYKHVVLGLIFLKYVDDAFTERREELATELEADGITGDDAEPLLESRDEYTAKGVFWVPPEARWDDLQASARQPEIGKLLDGAMDAIEVENPSLRGVLPKNYARPSLDSRRLGELVDLVSGLGLGGSEHKEKDLLGRVYEYFLGRFASAEGKGGGEFYTPRNVVKVLVEMIEPYQGRVYDPCCGSGGMFVQSEAFVEAHGGRRNDIAVYGQELNDTTWRLAKMNLAIRGIEADLGPRWGDSFHEDLHPDLKADFILANPPFNV